MSAAAVAAGGAAATAAGAAAGTWLFDYNRANYQFDQGQRWGRFTAARGFANAQVAQYREDIIGITSITQSKMDAWTTVSTLFLCVCAALSDAGRIGMHGAAPPGWLCALYSGNVFTSVLYCGLALWLSMHGSLRAQCAAVSLRTRKVRLPIPSTKQLDRARNLGSAYEKQEVRDIFRVPFCRHSQWAPEALPEGEGAALLASGNGSSAAAAAASGFGSTVRSSVPSWIRDEQVVDKGGGEGLDLDEDDMDVLGDQEENERPEHFAALQRAQEDWYCYDIYARVCMLYGSCHFLYAVTYYSIGTTICELRGFWVMWSLPMLFMTAQGLILRLDTLRNSKQKVLPNVELVGHTAPYWAVLACTLEFRHIYSPATVVIAWLFVILCFTAHMLMALRFLDLAWPDGHHITELEDRPGKEWWPRQWSVPSAFSKAMWLLAPPQKVKQGQDCLLHEMADLSNIGGGVRCRKRKDGNIKLKKTQSTRCKTVTKDELHTLDGKIDKKMGDLKRQMTQEGVMSEEQKRKFIDEQRRWDPVHRRLNPNNGVEATHLGNGDGFGGAKMPKSTIDSALKDLSAMVQELYETEIQFSEQRGEQRNPELNAAGDYVTGSPFHSMVQDGRRPADLPWQLTRIAIFTSVIVWLYMIIVSVCEANMGPESLMKPPGEPPWIRDTKRRHYVEGWVHTSKSESYPVDYKLWAASTATYGHGSEHAEDAHRRLEGLNETQGHETAYSALLEVLPRLRELIDSAGGQAVSVPLPLAPGTPAGHRTHGLPAPVTPVVGASFMAVEPRVRDVRWPAFFEPKLLAPCPAGVSVAALTPRGFGAIAALAGGAGGEARPFSLNGVGDFGPLAGASWTQRGLELVTKKGLLLHCPGGPPAEHGGAWECEASPVRPLPVPSGAEAVAAAVTELAGPEAKRVAALLLDSLPGTVALLEEDGLDGWLPMGQVHLTSEHYHGLSFSGEELVATARGGEVVRRNVRDGSLTAHPAPGGPRSREYHAAGAPLGGGLLRLALRRREAGDAGTAWFPELLGSD